VNPSDPEQSPASNWAFAAAYHPWYLQGEPDLSKIENLIGDPRVVAVGETGLDHVRHKTDEERARVERWFVAHAALAAEEGLPLIVHCVRAHADCIRALKSIGRGRLRGVIHAFSGSPEIAAEYWRLGFYVGIGAAVTRERSKRVRRAAVHLPLETILLETDAPFMATRDKSRDQGEAADILHVVDTVASLRAQPSAAIAETTYASAAELFAV
jgi:TatD DNase family protein